MVLDHDYNVYYEISQNDAALQILKFHCPVTKRHVQKIRNNNTAVLFCKLLLLTAHLDHDMAINEDYIAKDCVYMMKANTEFNARLANLYWQLVPVAEENSNCLAIVMIPHYQNSDPNILPICTLDICEWHFCLFTGKWGIYAWLNHCWSRWWFGTGLATKYITKRRLLNGAMCYLPSTVNYWLYECFVIAGIIYYSWHRYMTKKSIWHGIL